MKNKTEAWKVVRPVTAEILLGGGGWGWVLVVVVCKPILVFSLSLGQAEQYFFLYLVDCYSTALEKIV